VTAHATLAFGAEAGVVTGHETLLGLTRCVRIEVIKADDDWLPSREAVRSSSGR
jgi:hypothetical protein